jgi:lysozyme
MSIAKLLMFEEGLRFEVYYCSEKYPTIGIGWKIGGKNQPLEDFKRMQISEEAALAQCKNEVSDLAMNLHCVINCWQELSEARQAVLISMAYQMGIVGLMRFKKMIAAIEMGDFVEAAQEGMNSRWANQTYARANRHMRMMITDDWVVYSQLIDREV